MKLPAKKSLGQNFLNNPRIATTIAQAATIKPGELILEIGPGTGALTHALLTEEAHILALEADARAVTILKEELRSALEDGSLTLIHGDIRTYPILKEIKQPYKVVANIPYYLSGMLIRMFLEAEKQPETIVFLVQKEVAERIARSEKESLLSLSVKVYGTPEYVETVRKGNFTPQPSVDSAILRIHGISKRNFEILEESWFFTLLKTGFKARRKHLLGNLSELFPKETLKAAFETCIIPLDARGEDLSCEKWLALTTHLSPHRNKNKT